MARTVWKCHRRKALMKDQKNTGYPSIDKPWLKYYSEAAINGEIPKCTVFRNIYNNNKRNLSEVAIKYFGGI